MKNASLQRRPFLTPIWLTAAAAVFVLSFVGFAAWLWGTAGTADSTTIIVIRHAEKELGNVVDPPLTEAGEARAALLARMFGDVSSPGHVDAIYVTPAARSRLTAAPLAARLGLAPNVVSADDPRGLARRVLREHGGGRILVVGQSDTVPVIVGALSGNKNIPKMGTQEYGTMYIVTVPRIGHSNFLRLNY
jgi:broad specificity phosphatase PhoE